MSSLRDCQCIPCRHLRQCWQGEVAIYLGKDLRKSAGPRFVAKYQAYSRLLKVDTVTTSHNTRRPYTGRSRIPVQRISFSAYISDLKLPLSLLHLQPCLFHEHQTFFRTHSQAHLLSYLVSHAACLVVAGTFVARGCPIRQNKESSNKKRQQCHHIFIHARAAPAHSLRLVSRYRF